MYRFDPWSLLNALRNKAKSLGTYYIEGEVIDFGFKCDPSVFAEGDPNKEYEGINSVKVCVNQLLFYLNVYSNIIKCYSSFDENSQRSKNCILILIF